MDGDVNQTLGELERRLKELERELEAVGRSGEVDAEPAQASWTTTPAPPPGTTPFTASWSGSSAQHGEPAQPDAPPPTPNGAPPIPVRPPYWQPVSPPAASSAPAAEAPPAEEPQVEWTAPAQPAPEAEHAPEPQPSAQPRPQRAQPQAGPPPQAQHDQPQAQPAPAPQPQAQRDQPQAQPAPAPQPQAQRDQPQAQPAPAPQPQPPTPTAATEVLHGQLDELLAFRERLVRSTNELVDELSRVLADLGVELEAAEPAQPDPADTVLTGQVVVEAGPFPNLATLAAFEQALQRTDGVVGVHVRTLNEGHATIDVTLDEPTRLAAELRERAVVAFEVTEVDEHRLALAIDASSDAPLG